MAFPLDGLALTALAAERRPFPIVTSSGRVSVGVDPSLWRSGHNSLRSRAEELLEMFNFRCDGCALIGQDLRSVPSVGLTAIDGAVVGIMFAAVPGHGTLSSPRGKHTKAAVLDIANVSVPYDGSALSVLQ